MKTRTKLWIAVPVGLVAVLATLGGVKAAQINTLIKAGAAFAPPPESVSSAEVKGEQWVAMRGAIGSLVAVRGVTLGAEVPGLIREVAFDSGAAVKKGAVLVKLDTSTEEAQLAVGAGRRGAGQAQPGACRAACGKGEANTPADLDAAEARAKQTAGRGGQPPGHHRQEVHPRPLRRADRHPAGGAGPGAVGRRPRRHPAVGHPHLRRLLAAAAGARRPQGGPAGAASRPTPSPAPSWKGQITAINPEVDAATRNVRVRATFPNADGRLRPGMFANVEVLSPEKHDGAASSRPRR